MIGMGIKAIPNFPKLGFLIVFIILFLMPTVIANFIIKPNGGEFKT
jgi:hypothetical protein